MVMRSKIKKRSTQNVKPTDLWVASHYSLKGPLGERAWENRLGGPPSQSRYLELADIALGIKKAESEKPNSDIKHTALASKKTEPYST